MTAKWFFNLINVDKLSANSFSDCITFADLNESKLLYESSRNSNNYLNHIHVFSRLQQSLIKLSNLFY